MGKINEKPFAENFGGFQTKAEISGCDSFFKLKSTLKLKGCQLFRLKKYLLFAGWSDLLDCFGELAKKV